MLKTVFIYCLTKILRKRKKISMAEDSIEYLDISGLQLINGDRVSLASDRYGAHSGNPLEGTPYHCLGTITGITVGYGHGYASVTWNNGNSNGYASRTLRKVSSCSSSLLCSPNVLFKKHVKESS